jgi:PAS domain-containing protein
MSGQTARPLAVLPRHRQTLMDQIRVVSAEMKGAELSALEERSHEAILARRISLVFAIASLLLQGRSESCRWRLNRSFDRRRLAFEREMAGRIRAESSMLSATQEMVRTERINRSILDNSGDCIQLLEPDGRLVSVNRAGVRLMEVDDVHAFSKRPWLDLWSQNGTLASTALADAVRMGEGRFQGFCPTARGTPKWWDVLVTPIRDEGGRVTKLMSNLARHL